MGKSFLVNLSPRRTSPSTGWQFWTVKASSTSGSWWAATMPTAQSRWWNIPDLQVNRRRFYQPELSTCSLESPTTTFARSGREGHRCPLCTPTTLISLVYNIPFLRECKSRWRTQGHDEWAYGHPSGRFPLSPYKVGLYVLWWFGLRSQHNSACPEKVAGRCWHECWAENSILLFKKFCCLSK